MGNYISSDRPISSDRRNSSLQEDIGGVLFEKVKALEAEDAEKVTGMLLEMPEHDLEMILKDDQILKKKIDEAIGALHCQTSKQENVIERKKALGDIIYADVEVVYPEQDVAGKITGMLLEMDVEELESLTQNKQTLLDKIHEAANVLIRTKNNEKIQRCLDNILQYSIACQQCNETIHLNIVKALCHRHTGIAKSATSATREELGESLYEMIFKWHPDDEKAAKLTGMILEMNKNEIMKLTQEEELLKHKVAEAEQALR